MQLPASLPLRPLRTELRDNEQYVFDTLRKKSILLTPEEHVRQNLILFLREDLNVPAGLISLERGLRYNNLAKRYDLLVYDRAGQPALLCECKSPLVEIGEDTLKQAFSYNAGIRAPKVLLTNGKYLYVFGRMQEGPFTPLTEIGEFWKAEESG